VESNPGLFPDESGLSGDQLLFSSNVSHNSVVTSHTQLAVEFPDWQLAMLPLETETELIH
jgi:hypothetical protein